LIANRGLKKGYRQVVASRGIRLGEEAGKRQTSHWLFERRKSARGTPEDVGGGSEENQRRSEEAVGRNEAQGGLMDALSDLVFLRDSEIAACEGMRIEARTYHRYFTPAKGNEEFSHSRK
jgi:hypothetical protein